MSPSIAVVGLLPATRVMDDHQAATEVGEGAAGIAAGRGHADAPAVAGYSTVTGTALAVAQQHSPLTGLLCIRSTIHPIIVSEAADSTVRSCHARFNAGANAAGVVCPSVVGKIRGLEELLHLVLAQTRIKENLSKVTISILYSEQLFKLLQALHSYEYKL